MAEPIDDVGQLSEVTLVRVFCSDRHQQHQKLIDLLHTEHRVAGVTAFRGIAGFGRSGQLHEAGLFDIAAELPVVIEFFDRPERVRAVLPRLRELVGPGHIVCWTAHANLAQDTSAQDPPAQDPLAQDNPD